MADMGMSHGSMEHGGKDHSTTGGGTVDHSKMDHGAMDHSKMEQEPTGRAAPSAASTPTSNAEIIKPMPER